MSEVDAVDQACETGIATGQARAATEIFIYLKDYAPVIPPVVMKDLTEMAKRWGGIYNA